MKFLNNVEQFKGYVDYLRENENVLWRHLLVSGELSTDTHKVFSFCANVRNTYKSGAWDLTSRSQLVYLDHFMIFESKSNVSFVVKLMFLIILSTFNCYFIV